MKKYCTDCGCELCKDNWYDANTKKHHYICKTCSNLRVQMRRNKRRERNKLLFKQIKINGCAICGYDKCDAALDFHHVNPDDKKFQVNIHSLEFSEEKFIDEINKCILLCANCHREIHDKERGLK